MTVAALAEVTVFVPAGDSDPAQPSPPEPPLALQLVVFGGELQLRAMGVSTAARLAFAVSVVRLPVKLT